MFGKNNKDTMPKMVIIFHKGLADDFGQACVSEDCDMIESRNDNLRYNYIKKDLSNGSIGSVLNSATGISKYNSISENANSIFNDIMCATGSYFVHNDIIKINKSEKSMFDKINTVNLGKAIGINFAVNMLFALNTTKYKSYFNNIYYSDEDIREINHIAFTQSVKHSVNHTMVNVVLPLVGKSLIDKCVPKTVKENKVYKIFTDPSFTGYIGSIIFSTYEGVNGVTDITESKSCGSEYYKSFAKGVAKISMSERVASVAVGQLASELKNSRATFALKNNKEPVVPTKIKNHSTKK
jgi:hypothetical protein